MYDIHPDVVMTRTQILPCPSLGVATVESYSATVEAGGVTVEATGATVPVAPYTVDDGSNSFCSAALSDADKWTEVTRKAKTRKAGRPPGMQGSTEGSQEASPVKE
ncbi:hypothetical protein MHU86_15441 [Fragilaria crotonensis]|nr:hypothetical protein MHU86_15441 [Fragilaria crotonensis]